VGSTRRRFTPEYKAEAVQFVISSVLMERASAPIASSIRQLSASMRIHDRRSHCHALSGRQGRRPPRPAMPNDSPVRAMPTSPVQNPQLVPASVPGSVYRRK
jgi:transposase-like protein